MSASLHNVRSVPPRADPRTHISAANLFREHWCGVFAFDEYRNRLGFGRGFYDRLLTRIPVRTYSVALAFEFQIVDRVPSGSHDMPVDYAITEARTIRCKRDEGEGISRKDLRRISLKTPPTTFLLLGRECSCCGWVSGSGLLRMVGN